MINTNPEFIGAKVLEGGADWMGALQVYENLLTSNPGDVTLLERIGWCQSRAGLFDKSIGTYKKLVMLKPERAQFCYNVGYQYYMNKDWDSAIEWFKKALELYPKYFKVKYRVAYALVQKAGKIYKLKSQSYLEALKHLEDCDKLWDEMDEEDKEKNKSTYGDICFQKGKILLEKADNNEALNSLRLACSIDHTDINYRYEYGKALASCRKYDEALNELEKISGKYYINELKADILFNKGLYREALDILSNAVSIRKRDYLYRKIAEVHLELNEMQMAYLNIQKAIVLGPNNHKNRYVLAHVYYRNGLLNAALKECKLANELKLKEFENEYKEAKTFSIEISERIKQTNYTIDDEQSIKQLQEKTTVEKGGRIDGIIAKFKNDKGYGFINARGNSYFFHISDVQKENHDKIREGSKASFILEKGLKGPVAKKIVL